MSIGPMELVFLLLVTLFVVATTVITKGQQSWTLGLAVCVAIAMVVTPADLVSTFLVAAPYAVGYTYVVMRREQPQPLK